MQRGELFTTGVEYTPNKSWFDLSYENKFSFNLGKLVPSKFIETMPGDYIKSKSDSLLKFAPLLAPVMHKLNQFDYDFYVRLRDIWKPWDNFITNNDPTLSVANQSQFTAPVVPYFDFDFLNLSTAIGVYVDNYQYAYTYYDSYFTVTKKNLLLTESEYDDFSKHHMFYFVQFYMYYNGTIHELPKMYIPYGSLPKETSTSETIFTFMNQAYGSYWSSTEMTSFFQDLGIDVVQGDPKIKMWYNVFTPLTYSVYKDKYALLDFLNIPLPMSNNPYDIDDQGGEYTVDSMKFKCWALMESAIRERGSAALSVWTYEEDIMRWIANYWLYHMMDILQFGVGVLTRSDFSSLHFSPYAEIHGDLNNIYNGKNVEFSSNVDGSPKHYRYMINTSLKDGNEKIKVSILPLIAYHFIYDEYFKDQTTMSSTWDLAYPLPYDFQGNLANLVSHLGTPENLINFFKLRNKCWEHDVYTSALIDPQRGPDVLIPLGENGLITDVNFRTNDVHYNDAYSNNASESLNNVLYLTRKNGNNILGLSLIEGGDYTYLNTDQSNYITGISGDLDLTSASSATINSLRYAVKLQEFFEKKARSGGRYYEMMASFFGEFIEEAKIGRPVYLNGSRTPVQISEVVQTSSSNEVTLQPLGDYAGKATAVNTDNYVEFKSSDFGYYITITCVIPRTSYQGFLPKLYKRFTYLDYAWPQFGNLGEEPVLKQELLFTTDVDKNEDTFGYQSRYYDWKYRPDEVHGDFKTTLDFWHFGRKFNRVPQLNKEFIQSSFDYRQFAIVDENEDHLYCDCWNDIQVQRALPEYGIPSL